MSDVFTSLAAQALGIAPSIRPLATPMFAPSPPLANELPIDRMGENSWASLNPPAATHSATTPNPLIATAAGPNHTGMTPPSYATESASPLEQRPSTLPETTVTHPAGINRDRDPQAHTPMAGAPLPMATDPADIIAPIALTHQSTGINAGPSPGNTNAAITPLSLPPQPPLEPRSLIPSAPMAAPPTATISSPVTPSHPVEAVNSEPTVTPENAGSSPVRSRAEPAPIAAISPEFESHDTANPVSQPPQNATSASQLLAGQPSIAPLSSALPPVNSVVVKSSLQAAVGSDRRSPDAFPQSSGSATAPILQEAATSSVPGTTIEPTIQPSSPNSTAQYAGNIQVPIERHQVAQSSASIPSDVPAASNYPALTTHPQEIFKSQQAEMPSPDAFMGDHTAHRFPPVNPDHASLSAESSATGSELPFHTTVNLHGQAFSPPSAGQSHSNSNLMARSHSLRHSAIIPQSSSNSLRTNQDIAQTNYTSNIANPSVIARSTGQASAIASGDAQRPLQSQHHISIASSVAQHDDHQAIAAAKESLSNLLIQPMAASTPVNSASVSGPSSPVRPPSLQSAQTFSAQSPTDHPATPAETIQLERSSVADAPPVPEAEPTTRAVVSPGKPSTATVSQEAESSTSTMHNRAAQPDSLMEDARRLQRLTRDRPAAQPPSIRVSIGRIRIAATPPAPATSQFSRPRPALSLDQYLSRRQERQ